MPSRTFVPPDRRRWREPLLVWFVVLGTVFTTEAAVMAALPWILPAKPSRLLEATVDAILLTSVLGPLLWFLLVRPLREADRVRTEFLADLFASIEADRRRTAYDLHDGIGQSITLLISGLRSAAPGFEDAGAARRCGELEQLAKQALKDVKRLALGLRPSLLDDLGLAPALERLVSDVRENHAVEIALDAAAVADSRLPPAVETAVFRIAQEALANVVKHSNARRATVTVLRDARGVTLEVLDNGKGIPPELLRGRNPGHLGLTGMRERATLLGGDFVLESTSGCGTLLRAQFPLNGGRA